MSRPLTIREASERIGLSESAVRQLCQAGQLRHRRVGARRGRIRIDELDLQSYLDAAVVLPLPREEGAERRAWLPVAGYSVLRQYGYQP